MTGAADPNDPTFDARVLAIVQRELARAPGLSRVDTEKLVAERVEHDLDDRLPREVESKVKSALAERARWWKVLWDGCKTNWGFASSLLVLVLGSAGAIAFFQSLRISLHRNLLNFDETLNDVFKGAPIYSTAGIASLYGDSTGSARVWRLPFVAQQWQDASIHYSITYSNDTVPLPLTMKLVSSKTPRGVYLARTSEASGVIDNILSHYIKADSLRPEDGVYTLVVEAPDHSVYKGLFATGPIAVQVTGIPVKPRP